MDLEVFRNNKLSYMQCCIQYSDRILCIPFTCSDYLNTALDHFVLGSLQKLENSKNPPVAYDSELLSIFVNIFISLEQFVNTTHTIVYASIVNPDIPENKEAKELFRADFFCTLNKLFKLCDKNSSVNKKNKSINNLLKDLANCRNYIVHGNFGKTKINKTRLPSHPMVLNYEDIMEELNIVINLINIFRYILPGLDLMPNVRIIIANTLVYKKLDEYYYKFLVPYFTKIVEKHSLQLTKDFDLWTSCAKQIKKHFYEKISVVMYIKPDAECDYEMNKKETMYLQECILNLVGRNRINLLLKNGKFEMPNFMP